MINAPRGTRDILPGEIEKWQYLEEIARRLAMNYGYQEIRTPIFEHTELFQRGIGETTDIVQKEMYTFYDRAERSITLRPEGTASVIRSYLEHHLESRPQPLKLYYIGPMFRYDRPQAGRFRQFHQFGIECIGSNDPAVDAEIIWFTDDLLKKLGLSDYQIEINSIGCPNCRPGYSSALKKFFAPYKNDLCKHCSERLERNPLRVLDCKINSCREIGSGAPTILEYLCEDCKKHFLKVQNFLEVLGVSFTVNPRLVRGLDYYTHTAFEFVFPILGAQASIAGGGRYNNLIDTCGGSATPSIGMAMGLERVLLALEKSGVDFFPPQKRLIFVATTKSNFPESLNKEALLLLKMLRGAGYRAEKDYLNRSLKAQMKLASKIGACLVLILGEEEMASGKVVIRDMFSGNQFPVLREKILDFIKDLQIKEEGIWKLSVD